MLKNSCVVLYCIFVSIVSVQSEDLVIKALGRPFQLGDLWDARRSNFAGGGLSLWTYKEIKHNIISENVTNLPS
jgi:hypothetical protein